MAGEEGSDFVSLDVPPLADPLRIELKKESHATFLLCGICGLGDFEKVPQ
jgi:hypothetical protein